MAKKTNLENEAGGGRPEAEGKQPTEPTQEPTGDETQTENKTGGGRPEADVAPTVETSETAPVEPPTAAETYPPCPRCKNTAGKPVGKPFEQIFRGTEKIVTQYIKCTKCGQTYFTKTTIPLN